MAGQSDPCTDRTASRSAIRKPGGEWGLQGWHGASIAADSTAGNNLQFGVLSPPPTWWGSCCVAPLSPRQPPMQVHRFVALQPMAPRAWNGALRRLRPGRRPGVTPRPLSGAPSRAVGWRRGGCFRPATRRPQTRPGGRGRPGFCRPSPAPCSRFFAPLPHATDRPRPRGAASPIPRTTGGRLGRSLPPSASAVKTPVATSSYRALIRAYHRSRGTLRGSCWARLRMAWCTSRSCTQDQIRAASARSSQQRAAAPCNESPGRLTARMAEVSQYTFISTPARQCGGGVHAVGLFGQARAARPLREFARPR